ncbi:MAG: glycosyltransferase [Patescibacteria group bacterium]
MTVLYFGDYDASYTRTRILLKGLREHGATVVEMNERGGGISMYLRLWRSFRAYRGPYDAMVIGYGNARLMPLFARCIGAKRIIWEALFSKYDNFVFDRKLASPRSPKAYLYRFLDWLGCAVSDLVLLDTKLHTRYFHETFGVPERKLAFVYVGADTDIFYPRARAGRPDGFEIEFHGKYFPMQGTDVIIRAASLLEKQGVHFTLIGNGQELKRTKALAESLHVSNVTFKQFLPQEEIVEYVKNADMCIGLIGDVPRVVRAIPTKLWEAAAMGRVSINASPGSLEEVFTPGKDVIGITPGDHEGLARTILELKQSGAADAMGAAARETFLQYGTPAVVGKAFADLVSARFPDVTRT